MSQVRGNLDALRRIETSQQERMTPDAGPRDYGVPVEPDGRPSFEDELALQGLEKRSSTPPTSKMVFAHLEKLVAAKGHEYAERLQPKARRAVEEAVDTSVKSGMITEMEGDGMRLALAQEMIRRGFAVG